MSKNAELIATQEALRTLFISEPGAIPGAILTESINRVGSVLALHGIDIVDANALKRLTEEHADMRKALHTGAAPSPWPFEIGAVVYADGNGIEMVVTGYSYDGTFLVQCAYWSNGQCHTGTFHPARLREPT